MSKIGKLPIEVSQTTTVTIDGASVNVKAGKGELSYVLPDGIQVVQTDGQLIVSPKIENDQSLSAMFGLARANLANMVHGVEKGFERKLEIQGVGYRAAMQGSELVLNLGFAHPVKFKPVEGVTISVADNIISIAGIDKMQVGEAAAKIRSAKKPEPYKGKGIRYVGEQVRRKAGKAAKAVGAK